MSGHSKWATIKHKKGAADTKRGMPSLPSYLVSCTKVLAAGSKSQTLRLSGPV